MTVSTPTKKDPGIQDAPDAGFGKVPLGKRLVGECIAFARAKGYRKLALWTQSNLAAARAIYKRCGFRLVRKERHSSFGADLVGEFWQLAL